MNRRFFLSGLIAAPAVIAADRLMPVRSSIIPVVWGDGIHDDAPGLEAFFSDREFIDKPAR